MAIDALIQRLALAGAQQPGALDLSPAVSRWMGMIQAAQNTTAPVQAPAAADVAQPASARSMPETVPGTVRPHPVRNAILGLMGGGLPGLAAQIVGSEQRKAATERMQVIYSSLPDEYKPLFAADPQGFLASYMKNIEPQKLGEGEMAVFGGPNGSRVLNAKKLIDKESGKPVYLTEGSPVAFDSLGGDISAKDGLIISGREGIKGTYSSPEKLQMGETPGSFTPSVSGVAPAAAVSAEPAAVASARQIVPAAVAKNMVGFKTPTGDVAEMIRSRAAAAGLDENDQSTMLRIGQLESSLNPKVRNNGSSTGLFQFHPDTFAKLGGKNITDPVEQTDAAIRLYMNNRDALTAAGLPVTPTSLYLSHQQGIVGARALLEADPDARAIDALAPVYTPRYGPQKGASLARQAIVNNGGSDKMTAAEFLSKWRDKVEGASAAGDMGQPAAAVTGPAPAQGAPGWSLGNPVGMAGSSAPGGGQGLTGEDYLKTLPPQVSTQVKALADGRMPFPGGFALRSPYWQTMLQAVSQYDPNFDAVSYNARAQARKNFTSGAQGKNLTNLNTVINHAADLKDAIAGLRNFGGLATLANGATNWIYNHSDPAYQRARARYDGARGTLASDLVSALTGGGGALHDREYWLKQLDPDKSPDSLYGAVQEVGHLIESRVQPMREADQQAMGTSEDPFQVLFPTGAANLAKLRQGGESAGAQSRAGVPTLTPEQAAKLPSGTPFMTTDGRQMVRH